MPGFFDIIFRAPKPEPKAPQPKKAKKVKKAKKPKDDVSLVDSLRDEITELREMVKPHSSHIPDEEPEEEPQADEEGE